MVTRNCAGLPASEADGPDRLAFREADTEGAFSSRICPEVFYFSRGEATPLESDEVLAGLREHVDLLKSRQNTRPEVGASFRCFVIARIVL